MSLSKQQIQNVENVLTESIRNKFSKYNPEPAFMPFHTRLLGRDRLALYSFIHSLNTNFGTTVFEPVALAIAQEKFETAELQIDMGDKIGSVAQEEIQKIMDELITAQMNPNRLQEVERIRMVIRDGDIIKKKPTKVDLMLRDTNGDYFLFDLKTPKPNKGGFEGFKRTMLEWTAVVLMNEPDAKVHTCIAMPYNPYEPKPYARWTIRGMLDIKHELKVADEFWDFLGGEGTYRDLLDCFERVGVAIKDEIDDHFQRFNAK